jgi:hypothetical protein
VCDHLVRVVSLKCWRVDRKIEVKKRYGLSEILMDSEDNSPPREKSEFDASTTTNK